MSDVSESFRRCSQMLTLGSNQGLEVQDVNAKPIPPQSEAPFLGFTSESMLPAEGS